MKRSVGTELDDADLPIEVQGRLADQQRTERIVAAAPAGVLAQARHGLVDVALSRTTDARGASRLRTASVALSMWSTTMTSANSACPTATWACVRPSSSCWSPNACSSQFHVSRQPTTAVIYTSRAAGPSMNPGPSSTHAPQSFSSSRLGNYRQRMTPAAAGIQKRSPIATAAIENGYYFRL